MYLVVNWIIFVLHLGSKPDRSKTGGKKGLKVVQDPHFRRYSNKVDMDSALETFVPVRSDSDHYTPSSSFSDYCSLPRISHFWRLTVYEAELSRLFRCTCSGVFLTLLLDLTSDVWLHGLGEFVLWIPVC